MDQTPGVIAALASYAAHLAQTFGEVAFCLLIIRALIRWDASRLTSNSHTDRQAMKDAARRHSEDTEQ